MSHRAHDFVAGIRSAPEDDAARLVIADWYEEQGDLDRATLIRLQLERAALPRWHARRVHLELEERALLEVHAERWRQSLPIFEGVTWGSYERGFVRRVGFETVAKFAEHGAELMRASPFSGVVLRWPRLEDRPALEPMEGLRSLTLIGTVMQVGDMEWLAQCPLLSTIDTLTIAGSGMSAESLAPLLGSPHLERLRALRLPGHNFASDGLRSLMKASLPALVELDLSVSTQDELGSGGRYEPTFDADAMAQFAKWPVLGQLESLHLTGHQIGHDGLLALVGSPLAAGLRTLGIKSISDYDMDTGDRPDVLAALASVHPKMRLEELDIGENEFGPTHASVLAQSAALQELKVLKMDILHAQGGLQSMVDAPWFDSLRILHADDPGDPGLLEAIMRRGAKHLHTIRMVTHYGWGQMDTVGQALAGASELPSVLVLDVSGPGGADDVASFAKVSSLPNLVAFVMTDIWDEGLDEEATLAFHATPFGTQLKSLVLGNDADRLPPRVPSMQLGRWEKFAL